MYDSQERLVGRDNAAKKAIREYAAYDEYEFLGNVEAEDALAALKAAKKLVNPFDYDAWDRVTTFRMDVRIVGLDDEGNEDKKVADCEQVVFHPEEPECSSLAGHTYREVSEYSHNGGMVHVKRCDICGLTETYSTSGADGENIEYSGSGDAAAYSDDEE